MHAIPYLFSGMAGKLLRAQQRLEKLTGERWLVDWEQFAMSCPHRVRVSPWLALAESPDSLRLHLASRHKEEANRVARGRASGSREPLSTSLRV